MSHLISDPSGIREALFTHRWLIRRSQGFTSIICDTEEGCPNDPRALYILMAKLSGAITKGADLTIVLTAGAGPDLEVCGIRLDHLANAYLHA